MAESRHLFLRTFGVCIFYGTEMTPLKENRALCLPASLDGLDNLDAATVVAAEVAAVALSLESSARAACTAKVATIPKIT